ncbi:MAG: hypothetical protein M1828_007259 [Chrysothrix sp. TS-e1954]|nr:MAG: hypothetical protein M1828_007259 [Chrysothrix sp. TS-e1954]
MPSCIPSSPLRIATQGPVLSQKSRPKSRLPPGICNGRIAALQLTEVLQGNGNISSHDLRVSHRTARRHASAFSRDVSRHSSSGDSTTGSGTDDGATITSKLEVDDFSPSSFGNIDGVAEDAPRSETSRKARRPRLPPFMRELDPEKRFNDAPLKGLDNPNDFKTLGQRMKEAPFSTAFNLNPYAHALAQPVRECTVSGGRAPMSCMVDFHVYDKAKEKERWLLPLTLAASLIPRNLPDRLKSDKQVALLDKNAREHRSGKPTGAATHFLNRYDIIDGVHTNKRASTAHLSRSLAQGLQAEGLGRKPQWRPDMADFVLAALRKVVVKQLRAQFLGKKIADNIGPYASPPGEDDLARLDDMDNVMCVLKLKKTPYGAERSFAHSTPQSIDTQHDDSEITSNYNEDPFGIDDSSPAFDTLATDTEASSKEVAELQPVDEYQSEVAEPGAGGLAELNAADDVEARMASDHVHETEDPIAESPNTIGEDEAHTTAGATASQTSPTIRDGTSSSTYFRRRGHWSHAEQSSFLGKLNPLPPPIRPSTLYYPTIQYRNRRVAIFSLPQLLGETLIEQLLKGTCFADRTYVAMRLNPRTVHPHESLLKLQAYLAKEKQDSPRI